jgi:predicted metal-dependent hydrolase
MSQHSVPYGNERIHFTVRRDPGRPRTKVAIHVEADGRVTVDAPADATAEAIRGAVQTRAPWITLHRDAARKRMAQVLPREYVSGEALYYLGRRYRLKVLADPHSRPGAAIRGSFIEVIVHQRNGDAVRAVLETWYRARAREVLDQRMATLGSPLRWLRSLPPIRLQAMKLQWGSCSPAGRLTLNPALVRAPRECIDYVLLHELCHLQHHNHSPAFYRTLDRHLPDWRAVKERLDAMAESILAW